MQELIKILIGIFAVALGIPIGNYLAQKTKDELKQGKIWFKTIVVICLVGAVASLIFRNDVLLFSFLFVAMVTGRSLKR